MAGVSWLLGLVDEGLVDLFAELVEFRFAVAVDGEGFDAAEDALGFVEQLVDVVSHGGLAG